MKEYQSSFIQEMNDRFSTDILDSFIIYTLSTDILPSTIIHQSDSQ